jgi:hypothetical protein
MASLVGDILDQPVQVVLDKVTVVESSRVDVYHQLVSASTFDNNKKTFCHTRGGYRYSPGHRGENVSSEDHVSANRLVKVGGRKGDASSSCRPSLGATLATASGESPAKVFDLTRLWLRLAQVLDGWDVALFFLENADENWGRCLLANVKIFD